MSKTIDTILSAMPPDGACNDMVLDMPALARDANEAIVVGTRLLNYRKVLDQARSAGAQRYLGARSALEARAREAATDSRRLGVIALNGFEQFVETGRLKRASHQLATSLEKVGPQDFRSVLLEGLDRPDLRGELTKLGVDDTLIAEMRTMIGELPELHASSDGAGIDLSLQAGGDVAAQQLSVPLPGPRGRHRNAGDLIMSRSLRATIAAMNSNTPLPVGAVPSRRKITSIDHTRGFILGVVEGVAGVERHVRSLRDAGTPSQRGQDPISSLIIFIAVVALAAFVAAGVACNIDPESNACLALLVFALASIYFLMVVGCTIGTGGICGFAIFAYFAFSPAVIITGAGGIPLGD